MKQYCRYCSFCCYIDEVICYCHIKNKTMKDSTAKTKNHCSDFDFNPVDALFENEKGYRPKEDKMDELMEGQISLKVGE